VLYVRVAPNPIERRGTANRTPSSRAVGETITLRWTNGLFLPVSGVSNLEKLAAERRREELFLKLLEQFTRQGRNTCDKAFASTYAPTLFAKEDEAKQVGIRKADLEAAMRRLFSTDKIHLKPYGPPSKRVEGVFERLAERPLLPFRDHKQALDRRRPGLDLDDDLNIAVGRRRSGARGAGAASPRLGCHLVQRDPNLLKLLVQLLLVV
jgi:hypothetical protein